MRCETCGRFISKGKPCSQCWLQMGYVIAPDPEWDWFRFKDCTPLYRRIWWWLRRILRFLKRIICWRGED